MAIMYGPKGSGLSQTVMVQLESPCIAEMHGLIFEDCFLSLFPLNTTKTLIVWCAIAVRVERCGVMVNT
jgi:hypothetical protein